MEKGIFRTFVISGSFFVTVILHNLIYALFGFEEPFFFFVALSCIIAFPVSVFLNTLNYFKHKNHEETWKLGYLGFLGFLGVSAPILFPFFAFFLYFLIKK